MYFEKDDKWPIPLVAGLIGVLGVMGGSSLSNYHQERSAQRQVQHEMTRQMVSQQAAEHAALKEAATRYMAAGDALVSALVYAGGRDKGLVEYLNQLQAAGAEVMVAGDEALTRQTSDLSAFMASLLVPTSKPIEQRLLDLQSLRAEWLKQLRRSLEKIKSQNDDAMSQHLNGQAVAALKR